MNDIGYVILAVGLGIIVYAFLVFLFEWMNK